RSNCPASSLQSSFFFFAPTFSGDSRPANDDEDDFLLSELMRTHRFQYSATARTRSVRRSLQLPRKQS
ncbi:hypothetical protein, partial [Erwinia amylovora]|uniref:hypothetical protein n=1 Tax=Erwinia amylovora TaxID=552 RepID=UPI0020BF9C32